MTPCSASFSLTTMSDPRKQFRLLEIGPLKEAMMSALREAVQYQPILQRRGERFLVEWNELELSIACLSSAARDERLQFCCDNFQRACKEATDLWLECARAGRDQTYDEITEAYKAKGADQKIKAVKDHYVSLTEHLEDLL